MRLHERRLQWTRPEAKILRWKCWNDSSVLGKRPIEPGGTMFVRRLAAILLFMMALSAAGAIRPSFSEHYSAWHATHVIVVDSSGAILESWKGDLKAGGMLPLEPLGVPKTEAMA